MRSLYHLLDRAALAHPDKVALRFNGRALTYAQFHARVNAVARALVEQGLERQERVGLLMSRSFDSVAAIFGIMKAGGAYLPLDATAPAQRSAAMLANAQTKYLLTEEELRPQAEELRRENSGIQRVLGLRNSVSWESIYSDFNAPLPDFGLNERDLAVMFHTSGTTGVPKGVAHSHRSMLSVVEWAVDQFRFTSNDVFSCVTSHSFELSWLELYASVAAMGEIVLAPESWVRFSPAELATLTEEAGITIWCSVPSVLMRLSERGDLDRHKFASLRRVHFAGERFPTKHLRRLMQQVPHPQYTNMLGTTETHIIAFYELPSRLPDDLNDFIPVGKACAHVNLGAIGKDNTLVPEGEVGELVVRGPSLMNGYWQLPERTAQSIIDVRFGPDLVDKAYRTGDLVKKDQRGDYHIIGRADRRVKVKGAHIVDLDEVEAVLLTGENVEETAAFNAGEEGIEHIEAAVVAKKGEALSAAALRVHVARILPTYAVPERIYVLDALPRLGNGKISRRDVRAKASVGAPAAVEAEDMGAGPIDRVRGFIAKELLENPSARIAEDADLIEDGSLTSMSVVSVVTFIEQSFGVAVPNDEFQPANFRSLKKIADLIERLRKR